MATLQRSSFSFRRQGSSGLVWDDKFINGEFRQRYEEGGQDAEYRELRSCQSARPIGLKELHGSFIAAPIVCSRSFSTTAPKEQAASKGRFSKILPVGFRRSETIKKSNSLKQELQFFGCWKYRLSFCWGFGLFPVVIHQRGINNMFFFFVLKTILAKKE